MNRLIIEWVEKSVLFDAEKLRQAAAAAGPLAYPGVPPSDRFRRFWAEAALERYSDVMPEWRWSGDLILTTLREPLREEMHREIPRIARELWERKRIGKK